MYEQLQIYYLYNCGLYFRYMDTGILVDALNGAYGSFSAITPDLMEEIADGMGIFDRVDALFFTHTHGDHYDARLVERYRKHQPNVPCILPGTNGLEDCTWTFGPMTVTGRIVPHAADAYRDVVHTVLLVRAGDTTVYLAADAAFTDAQIAFLHGETVQAAFFNPLYLGSPAGRQLIRDVNARRTYIYHIPAEKDDIYRMRRLAASGYKKHAAQLGDCTLLLEPMQHIVI